LEPINGGVGLHPWSSPVFFCMNPWASDNIQIIRVFWIQRINLYSSLFSRTNMLR
jgi:hypothetical protein